MGEARQQIMAPLLGTVEEVPTSRNCTGEKLREENSLAEEVGSFVGGGEVSVQVECASRVLATALSPHIEMPSSVCCRASSPPAS